MPKLYARFRRNSPTFRMRKRGFKKKEIAQKLNEYGVYITPVTLAKYMNELGKKKKAKQDKVRKRE